jgi:putative transposase
MFNQKLPGGVLRPELLRELGYDPYKDAVLTIEEMEDLIWDALKVYHIDKHDELGRPPGDVWRSDLEAYGVDVIGDHKQLAKSAGKLRYPCQLSRSGVEMLGLRFHDEALTGTLLEDLIPLEPVRSQRRRGSATAKVKVKYNPANLAEIHVWNQVRNVYVTLPCTDERYSEGISEWHHEQLKKWANAQGLEFSSEEQRQTAKATLSAKIDRALPDLQIRRRKAIARLLRSPRVQEVLGTGVSSVAFAPSRHDGLAPVIRHELLAPDRQDAMTPPKAPNRGNRKSKSRSKPRLPTTKANSPMSFEDEGDATLIKPTEEFRP